MTSLPSRLTPRRGSALVRLFLSLLAVSLVVALAPARPAAAEPTAGRVTAPRLLARATLSADYLAPGPRSGAQATPANGRTGPFNGQVIPGFSAAVSNSDGTFWAMPDSIGSSLDVSSRALMILVAVEVSGCGRCGWCGVFGRVWSPALWSPVLRGPWSWGRLVPGFRGCGVGSSRGR